jgi:hypothetical protein
MYPKELIFASSDAEAEVVEDEENPWVGAVSAQMEAEGQKRPGSRPHANREGPRRECAMPRAPVGRPGTFPAMESSARFYFRPIYFRKPGCLRPGG